MYTHICIYAYLYPRDAWVGGEAASLIEPVSLSRSVPFCVGGTVPVAVPFCVYGYGSALTLSIWVHDLASPGPLSSYTSTLGDT